MAQYSQLGLPIMITLGIAEARHTLQQSITTVALLRPLPVRLQHHFQTTAVVATVNARLMTASDDKNQVASGAGFGRIR